MRICVVGCGAIGGLYAAHLAQLDDVEVWAYDVSREHVDAINRDGLRLTGAADLLSPVRACADASDSSSAARASAALCAIRASSICAASRSTVVPRKRSVSGVSTISLFAPPGSDSRGLLGSPVGRAAIASGMVQGFELSRETYAGGSSAEGSGSGSGSSLSARAGIGTGSRAEVERDGGSESARRGF